MNSLLRRLDPFALARLAGVPSSLVPPPNLSPRASILQLARLARGDDERVWEDRLSSCSRFYSTPPWCRPSQV